jgi:hypothetical protein
MALVAQISGAVALTALVVGPWWARVPEPVPSQQTAAPAPIVQAPAAQAAHLNLDVRHSFRKVQLTIAVDDKPVLDTALEGNGKRFKVFGKRSERGYAKTLELNPGVRLVRVRVRSVPDNFDQTRVERFDLGAASVAALRVAADKSGLTLVAERPASLPSPTATTTSPPPSDAVQAGAVPASPSRPATAAVIEFLHSLRSMLIGIAGFVASTATAFVVQEWLRSRRSMLFVDEGGSRQRRRRRVQGAITE